MRLHVEGAGPVLLLHGVAGAARTYSWLDLPAVRLDFRGHGASERAPGTYLLEHYVADAVAVLSDMGPSFVAGHSLGGVVAWTVAQKRPDLVTGLCLEDPPLFMGEPENHVGNVAIPAFVQMREDTARWQAAGTTPAQVARELAASSFFDGRPFAEIQTPEALDARGYALTHLDLEVLDPVIDGTLLAQADVVSAVTVPCLIVAADDAVGAAFPTRHEARLAATHPQVEVVRLAGASHTIHDERAHRDEWTRLLRSRL